ncbi:DUF1822 family protein [Neosynechococcus sphagnicola]|uniref:DUF1822 family protein n=1 Tax=Neosynechococcus sphagnicola TaxID=1501145 RepID=UPI000689AC36|nr:DUF1822 family protein [Neosynechococcus sphagnicola]
MNSIHDFALPLPIIKKARQFAQTFAADQPDPQKSEQVYYNTLAVWVMRDYLQLLAIDTDLESGDSWNPMIRCCSDVADLVVTGLGRLECRPLWTDQPTCPVPPEVWEDRLGYVIVHIDPSQRQAAILGFTQTAGVEELSLSQLQPVESCVAYLHHLQGAADLGVQPPMEARPLVQLGQWLQGQFDATWQEIAALMDGHPAFSFRGLEGLELSPR